MPGYKPGDHVLTFNWIVPIIGDVVVFKQGGKHYIKRIVSVLDDLVELQGDNKSKSSSVNPVRLQQIVGRVILKY